MKVSTTGTLSGFVRTAGRLTVRAARLSARDPSEALLLARMALWVTLLSVASRALSLPRLMRLMRPLRARTAAARSECEAARVARLLDALLATDLFVFEPVCWKRAPVLYRFLALKGFETRILFGLRRDEAGGVEGHAWLESGGAPVFEASVPRYRVTYAFPPGSGAAEAKGGGEPS